MSLKRKRPSDTPSPLSTSSILSRSSASPSPTDAYIQAHPSPSWIWQQQPQRTNDSGRTRKRYRDGRPDERVIHQTTLHKLFTAQKQHLDTTYTTTTPSTPAPSPTQQPNQPIIQNSTLHRFWSIAQPLADPAASSFHPASFEDPLALRCENCDTALSNEDDMDVDMDGGGDGEEYACRCCGRKVCGNCSIAGDVRSCLGCATS